jgi:hypothetical protein
MKPYFYVLKIDSDKPPTRKHDTMKSAVNEAERLAKRQPKDTFEVLACVAITKMPTAITFVMDGVKCSL